jgi:hypothetical protein
MIVSGVQAMISDKLLTAAYFKVLALDSLTKTKTMKILVIWLACCATTINLLGAIIKVKVSRYMRCTGGEEV